MLTLKKYAELAGLDPCSLAGFDSCFDCQKRGVYLGAIKGAEQLADDFLRTKLRRRLLDTDDVIVQTQDTICQPGIAYVVRTSYEIEAVIVWPEQLTAEPACMQRVRLAFDPEGVIPDGADIVSVRVCDSFYRQACQRFPVDIEDFSITEGGSVLVYSRAYNFVDYAQSPQPFRDVGEGDTVVYLETVPLCVTVETPSVPRAIWPVCPCACDDDPCAEAVTTGCVQKVSGNCYRMIVDKPCGYDCPPCTNHKPRRYEINVVRRGIDSASVDQAIFSWSNTLLSEEACSACGNGVMTARWSRDVSIQQGDVIPYGEYFARRVLASAAESYAVGGL